MGTTTISPDEVEWCLLGGNPLEKIIIIGKKSYVLRLEPIDAVGGKRLNVSIEPYLDT